mgnify:CR=1 FL=1
MLSPTIGSRHHAIFSHSHIMEFEASRMHGHVYHRGLVYSNIRGNEGSHLSAPTVNWLFGDKTNWPSNVNHLLQLSKLYTPHLKSNLSCKEKTHWGAVSSYPWARNREKARSPNNQHRGEYCRLPDNATSKSTFQNTEDNDGARTRARAKRSQWTTAKGKMKVDPVGRTKKAKSKESEYREDEDATLSEDVRGMTI